MTNRWFFVTILFMKYEEFYEKISKPYRSHPEYLQNADIFFALVFYISYPLLLIYIWMSCRNKIIFYIVLPALFFLLCTVIRKKLNFPRPYEKYGISPIIHKNTKGKSFPSRHVFSATLIAMTVLSIVPVPGCILYIFSVIEAYIRVAGGVHTPKDVLAAFVSGSILGACFFFL